MSSTQTASHCRVLPSAKHLHCAELWIVEGLSAFEALTRAGYSRTTARNPGALLRNNKGLRAAVAIVMERTNHYIGQTPPPRRRRYDRRATARLVQAYVTPDSPNETSNKGTNAIYEQERQARAIVAGKPLPQMKPQDKVTICQHCYAQVKEKDRQLNASSTLYVCSRQSCLYS